ncbi:MAG: MoaD/ThiS family protein [Sedimentibacter sp.]|uniref:MoaD/ThiS family protein n=1 Tax=Sedimentibacter sp. TaxID=1960295 RepID=UPI003159193E
MISVNGRMVECHAEMTVWDAIIKAGEISDNMTLVMVNGRVVDKDRLRSMKLEGFESIKLLRIVSGG